VTGLGVIMGAHRRAGRCGRRLVLRDVPPQMQRLLVATRLHRVLAVEGATGVESLLVGDRVSLMQVTGVTSCAQGG
ncbi:hypothetical protein ACTWQJ_36350, partial [Streptomyces sp. KR55]